MTDRSISDYFYKFYLNYPHPCKSILLPLCDAIIPIYAHLLREMGR